MFYLLNSVNSRSILLDYLKQKRVNQNSHPTANIILYMPFVISLVPSIGRLRVLTNFFLPKKYSCNLSYNYSTFCPLIVKQLLSQSYLMYDGMSWRETKRIRLKECIMEYLRCILWDIQLLRRKL